MYETRNHILNCTCAERCRHLRLEPKLNTRSHEVIRKRKKNALLEGLTRSWGKSNGTIVVRDSRVFGAFRDGNKSRVSEIFRHVPMPQDRGEQRGNGTEKGRKSMY